MTRPTPNFVILDGSLPVVGRLVAAMVQARDAVDRRLWSHPQEPTTEDWWADVLADPRARTPRRRGSEVAVERRCANCLQSSATPSISRRERRQDRRRPARIDGPGLDRPIKDPALVLPRSKTGKRVSFVT
jgi:hypothetical protein